VFRGSFWHLLKCLQEFGGGRMTFNSIFFFLYHCLISVAVFPQVVFDYKYWNVIILAAVLIYSSCVSSGKAVSMHPGSNTIQHFHSGHWVPRVGLGSFTIDSFEQNANFFFMQETSDCVKAYEGWVLSGRFCYQHMWIVFNHTLACTTPTPPSTHNIIPT
jgi:hypothetical protein